MKTLLLSALFLSSALAGPIHVGNGGGESEFNILLAQRQLPRLLSLCQLQKDCAVAIGNENSSALSTLFSMEITIENFSEGSTQKWLYSESKNQLKINQGFLWNADEKALVFAEAVQYLVQFGHESLNLGTDQLATRIEEMAKIKFPMNRIDFGGQENIECLNLRDGHLAFSKRSFGVVQDSLLFDVSSSLASIGQDDLEGLVLGNINFSYHVDLPEAQAYYWNAKFEFQRRGKSWTGMAFVKITWDVVAKKFVVDQTDFWITNLKEKLK